jgi:hypothetical protein
VKLRHLRKALCYVNTMLYFPTNQKHNRKQ